MNLALVLTLLTAHSALGGFLPLKAPDFDLSASSTSDATLSVVATPPAKHHINVQAPVTADLSGKTVKLEVSSPSEVHFKIPADSTGTFTVSLFLCDDAGTFCEKHSVTRSAEALARDVDRAAPVADLGAPKKPRVVVTAKPIAPAPGTETEDISDYISFTSAAERPPGPSTDEHGFLVNEPEVALTTARKENKPLLIDFFGIWCPPCNEYDEEVFSKTKFEAATAGFVRLKLDADSPVSWELKSKFKVGGYPTIVFASPSGDEISRVVGFRPAAVFFSEVTRALKDKDVPFSAALANANHGDAKAAARVGRTYLERAEYDSAVKYLERASGEQEALYTARIGLAEKAEDDAKLTSLLEAAIRDLPHAPDSIEWRSKLADLYDGQKKADAREKILEDQVAVSRELIANPRKLEGHDLAIADLLGTIAEAYDGLGKTDSARAAWKKTALEYKRRIGTLASSKQAYERGYNLERAYALWKSGQTIEAEELYKKLEAKYPAEFTFFFAHSKMNLELKRYPEAQALAERALQYSYGDNRLRVAETLAKAMKAQDHRSEARAVIRDALVQAKLPDDASIRTHRYANALRKLEKELGPETTASNGT